MSRGAAKRAFTVGDVSAQTAGVECRKDAGIIDELPGAYKDIDAVMVAQRDLVEVVATLKALVCVKGKPSPPLRARREVGSGVRR
jgi:tRNA-splicing ligase RtcB